QSFYVELSQRLLDSRLSLTKSSYRFADSDFKEKTVAKIGAIWQDHRTGWSVLQAIATERNVWYVQDQAVIQLSRIAKIHSEALVYLQEFARQGKSEAIEALATHWRDNPQTLPIIQQQANKGEHRAIEALANHWRDHAQTLPIIQQLANKAEGEIIGLLTALARITIDSEIGAIIETILARTDVDAKIKEGFQEFLYYSNFRDWRNPD
ncbi:MAG: signal transduction protein, partial [Microcystis sp.]